MYPLIHFNTSATFYSVFIFICSTCGYGSTYSVCGMFFLTFVALRLSLINFDSFIFPTILKLWNQTRWHAPTHSTVQEIPSWEPISIFLHPAFFSLYLRSEPWFQPPIPDWQWSICIHVKCHLQSLFGDTKWLSIVYNLLLTSCRSESHLFHISY